MLWIHADRFARGNAKEDGIELGHIVDKSPFTRIHLAGQRPLWVIKVIDIPAAAWHLLHEIRARGQELPELFRCLRPWETASHADNGNWFSQAVGPFPCCGQSRHCLWRGQGEHLGQQIGGQLIDGGIFKGDGRGQRALEPLLQRTAQFKRHERIHAQIGKTGGALGQIDHPQHTAHRALEIMTQLFFTPPQRQGGQCLDKRSFSCS